MTAIEDLTELLQNLPNASLLSDKMKSDALDKSLIPSSPDFIWPGKDGYVPTYDIYYAAINLIGFLRAQPVVRQSSSEGTSVSVDAPYWEGLISYFKAMSPICLAQNSSVIVPVYFDNSHVVHTDMSGGAGDGSGDIDTDVS